MARRAPIGRRPDVRNLRRVLSTTVRFLLFQVSFFAVKNAFLGVPMASTLDCVGPSFTYFYLFLLGFTGFYWVLLGFTGFYWVLNRVTGFYRVKLGYT